MNEALLADVERLCGEAVAASVEHSEERERATAIRARLHEPLRIAIAGRLKAGKSTLLNALVGERVAPTDAGECTRIVTWYRNGLTFEVTGELDDGTARPFSFRRTPWAVEIDLDGTRPEDLRRLDVRWPSRKLEHRTLIDTPGLEGAMANPTEARARDPDDPGHADAVIYLMRHLHRTDAAFLESFYDRSLSQPSPFNAVAVLSRADEIGAGRLDAMRSAAAIADRYATEDRVRSLCATVVPVAGLIAETATTLTEDEVASLRQVAGLSDADRAALLLSVDRFRSVDVEGLDSGTRRALLARFGLFGLRFSVAALCEGEVRSASDLADLLWRASGIQQLIDVLERHFRPRSDALRARSALSRLKTIALRLQREGNGAGTRLLGEIERVESRSVDLALLRLTHLLLSGQADVDDGAREEILRLGRSSAAAEQLGADRDADLGKLALARIDVWRRRSVHPLNDPITAEACGTVARAYEDIYRRVEHQGQRQPEEQEEAWASPTTS